MIAALAGWPAHAQQAPALHTAALAEVSAAAAPGTGGEIVVIGRRTSGLIADRALASVDRLDGETARRQNVDAAWQLLGQLPGVTLTAFNQGTSAGKFSFRGFNGEGEINAVKLIIDGVPSNSNDGNMPFLDMIFPLEIDRIEIVRGTANPRWGLHAIAGTAAVTTRSGQGGVRGQVLGGSHATVEAQAAAGLEQGSFTQDYLMAWRRSGGFRHHSGYERASLAGKWFATTADGAVRIGLVARHYRASADEPGYLDAADAAADPARSYPTSASDGGTRRIGQYSLQGEARLADGLDAALRLYVNTFDDRRFIRFSAAVTQQERYGAERQHGATVQLRWHPAASGLGWLSLEAGGDVQAQANRSSRWLTADRRRLGQTRDQDFTLAIGGAYVEAVADLAPWLTLAPGYRIDWVGGTLTDNLVQRRYAANRYGAIHQPKLSLAARPLAGLALHANWGRTYQIGVGAGSYLIPPRAASLAPSRNTGWEIGAKLAVGAGTDLGATYWRQDATGEVRRKLNDPAGDYDNLGATRRQGAELQLSARPSANLAVWASIAWQEARIVTPDPASPDSAGKQVDHVPPWLLTGGVRLERGRWLLSLWGTAQGSYFLEKTNRTGRFGGTAQLNLEATRRLGERIDATLAIRNLTDRAAEYVWWDGTQTLHSPAAGRNLSLALAVRL